MIYRQIDNNGFSTGVEKLFGDNEVVPNNYISESWGGDTPLHKPRWVDNSWVEGATPEEIKAAQAPDAKTLALYKADNAFILYCRSLNLPDKASKDDFNKLVVQMQTDGQIIQGLEIATTALALINDITQQGGMWETITWHNL